MGRVPLADEFTLECPEETLNTGVAQQLSRFDMLGGNAVSGEHQLVSRGGIQATEDRVVQKLCQWILVCQRHRDGLLGQLHG